VTRRVGRLVRARRTPILPRPADRLVAPVDGPAGPADRPEGTAGGPVGPETRRRRTRLGRAVPPG